MDVMSSLSRRSFLGGLIAAPVVIAAGNLMPLRGLVMPTLDEVKFFSIGEGITNDEIRRAIEIMRRTHVGSAEGTFYLVDGSVVDRYAFHLSHMMIPRWLNGTILVE